MGVMLYIDWAAIGMVVAACICFALVWWCERPRKEK